MNMGRRKVGLTVSVQHQLVRRVRAYARRSHGGNVSRATEVLLYVGLRKQGG